MNALTIRAARRSLRREICAWQRGALGLFALSLAWNLGQTALNIRLTASLRETAAQLEQAEHTRDYALEKLGSLALQMERSQQESAALAAACEAAGTYQYIGECTITAYCPCAECCGQWADGLTAAGLPAVQGIVAVDPDVIPLGSTVVIDGQKYLAADTGVTGLHVDVCLPTHAEAEAFGVQAADVWVVAYG